MRSLAFAAALSFCATTQIAAQATPYDSAKIRALNAEEERIHNDWANLKKFSAANSQLPPPAPGEDRVVFMGNSIFESWAKYFPTHFPGKPYVNRGISGQTTPQMLVRFRQDVIDLKPKAVVILAGTNDIAGNTGPSTLEMIEDNITSMVELAKSNGIRVVLVSVLPAFSYRWKPSVQPAPIIVALNQWMKSYSEKNRIVFLDLHTSLADERMGMRIEYSGDGVHPNEAAYRVMAPLTEAAIRRALR